MPSCGVSHPLEGSRGLLCLLAKFMQCLMSMAKEEDAKEAYEWLEFKDAVKAHVIAPEMVSTPVALTAKLPAIRVCRQFLLHLACRAPLEGSRGLLCLLAKFMVKEEDAKEAYEWLEFNHVVKARFIVLKMVSTPAKLGAKLPAIRVCFLLHLVCRALLLS
mmetsp:Transcript_14008/g.44005  ORF Transcript_14008/g.44005 Transcript_14008/m.44005 type:complete len:161 (+) Transcript_14008:154-636(+)